MEPIITSMLDSDQYLLTMQNAICSLYPHSLAKYEFFNRGKTTFPDNMAEELKKQIIHMSNLQLTKEEKNYLKSTCYYLNPVYLDFLSGYRYNPDEVSISQENGNLKLEIVGPFYRTIMWEVPLMAIISELYFKLSGLKPTLDVEKVAAEKIRKLSQIGIKLSDFGTRRRFSKEVHELVVKTMKETKLWNIPNETSHLQGTSNVDLARKYNLTPIGTMAHCFISYMSAKYGYRMANEMAMEKWQEIYQGDLGVVLPDTFTTNVFLQSFTTKYAKLFDGVRCDSGNTIDFGNKIINHYKKLKIDPSTKSIIFSDNINDYKKVENIVNWHKSLTEKPRLAFGIGTWLSNDTGQKPLNMVIKLVAAKPNGLGWVPVCKLSDNISKRTGPQEAIDLCCKTLDILI